MESYQKTATDATVERISLLDSLGQEWLKLPHIIMRCVGPAAQTWAGLVKVTSTATFSEQAEIIRQARVPPRTARHHLITLEEHGWVINQGRQRTRSGKLRQTATIELTTKSRQVVKDKDEQFGYLPWWFCCRIQDIGRPPWCARAVLSIVMAQLCKLKAGLEKSDPEVRSGEVLNIEDIEDAIPDVEERFRFSLNDLQDKTGLDRKSVTQAKRWLFRHDIIDWSGTEGAVDLLRPRADFHVTVTPGSGGGVYLAFG